MGRKIVDLTGRQFGDLYVERLYYRDKVKKVTFWLCTCRCLKTKIINGESLKRGNTTTCGHNRAKRWATMYKFNYRDDLQ